MLGNLVLQVSDRRRVEIFGGPYREKPAGYFGVKMAEEIPLACDVDIPTEDFNVPEVDDLANGVNSTVAALLAGKKVYVGCMGGKGRTGLFLSVLAKAFGIENPVEYVRANYYRHAVETPEQYDYVAKFPTPLYASFRLWVARLGSKIGIGNDEQWQGPHASE